MGNGDIMSSAAAETIAYRRPPLYGKQQEAIFHKSRYGLIEASTKSGKTHGAIAWLTEQALLHGRPGRHYWWVAPVYPQAKIAYRRLRRAMPADLQQPNDTDLSMALPNGATLWFKSGEKPDNLYGEDVYAAVLDEASRMREEAWHAVRSTLTATRGPVRCIGNVRGRKNWFYRLARRAETGEADMAYHRITAHDAIEAGVLVQSEIEDAKRQLPDSVFRELYLAEATDDAGNPFGIEAIRACTESEIASGDPVAWGWDLAKSQDWTVGIGLSKDGSVCRYYRFQKPWQETFEAILRETGHTPALVDSTGVGDPIVERLQREGGAHFEGYHFTSTSKQKLMEGLAAGIQKSEARYPDGVIRLELEAFEYEYSRSGVRYSAPEGQHDDCVCALALAYHKLRRPVLRWRAL